MKRLFSLLLSIILLITTSAACISASSESATAQLQEMYAQGELLMAQGDYAGAATQFETLGAYSDASQMAMYCKGIMAAEDLGMFDVAVLAFQGLGDFKDSKQLMSYYQGRSYQAVADALIDSEKRDDLVISKDGYDKAVKLYSGLALFKDCLTRLSACQSGSVIAQDKIHAYDYAAANKLEQDGKYEEAMEAFKALGSYSDSAERAVRIADDHKFEIVGNTVIFGTYEQDNNISNGSEPIEWIVLDVQDKKALLISRYALDAHAYHPFFEDVTWETCELRSWLNGSFMNTAFSAEEQSAILMTSVDNSDRQGNSEWNTSGGNDTNDKLFLLSYAEAGEYLSNDVDRMCVPTDYAIAQGAYPSELYKTDGRATGSWWLRSPGLNQRRATYVIGDGSRSFNFVSSGTIVCVRPSFWLSLESDIF